MTKTPAASAATTPDGLGRAPQPGAAGGYHDGFEQPPRLSTRCRRRFCKLPFNQHRGYDRVCPAGKGQTFLRWHKPSNSGRASFSVNEDEADAAMALIEAYEALVNRSSELQSVRMFHGAELRAWKRKIARARASISERATKSAASPAQNVTPSVDAAPPAASARDVELAADPAREAL